MPFFLGVDIGGSVIKSGLYDENGREIAVASRADPAKSPQIGFSERHMELMWENVCATISEAIQKSAVAKKDIRGVSFSAHGKGLYAVDEKGDPVRAGIISSDNRAINLVSAYKEQGIDKKAWPFAYQQIWASHPTSLLAWLKQNEPENYRRIDKILMAHDWIRYRLTGAFGAEITNLSGSNLFNINTRAYEPALFKLFDIAEMEERVAPVVGSTECVSGVSKQAAELTGLLENTPVFGGFFDVVSAAVCAGLADSSAINVVMGTWTIETWVTDAILPADYPYIWSHYCIPNKYFVHEGSPTSASNLEWFIKNFMAQEKNPYARCESILNALPKAASKVQFLPYLLASNLGDSLSGGFYGLANAHQSDHLVQAVFEGICFAQQVHLERILALSGKNLPLRLTGGPTKSKPWMQMVADISGQTVEIMDVKESGCLGAAIAASVGAGFYRDFPEAMQAMCPTAETVFPDDSVKNAYAEKFAAFQSLAKQLAQVGF